MSFENIKLEKGMYAVFNKSFTEILESLDPSDDYRGTEFEGKADAILISFGVQNQAIFDIISGKNEPSGLLPMQMPANMMTVEQQNEDVPRDMVCYKDADGNTYDFAFGMNWSGVINDARVAAYK